MSDLKVLENTVGDFPILFQFSYVGKKQIRVPEPGGFGETVHSHWEPYNGTWHCVAPNEAVARAIWTWKHPNKEWYDLKEVAPLCVINYIVPIK